MFGNYNPVRSFLFKLQQQDLVITHFDDGDGEWQPIDGSRLRRRALAAQAVISVDECRTRVVDFHNNSAYLLFISSNDPDEILADWSCESGTPVDVAISAALDAHSDQWAGKAVPAGFIVA